MGAAAGRAGVPVDRRHHTGPRGGLPGALLDRGGLSLARGARHPGGSVRLRPGRRRRTDAQSRRSRGAGAGGCRRGGTLRVAVRGGRALRHGVQGRRRRCGDRPDGFRHGSVAAARHPRGRPGVRRRLREPGGHQHRRGQYARAVRLSVRHRGRNAGGHPPARLVASGLGCPGRHRALDPCLDAAGIGPARIALGRPVPGRRIGPVRLGDLAAALGEGESVHRGCGPRLVCHGRHRRAARRADRPGRW